MEDDFKEVVSLVRELAKMARSEEKTIGGRVVEDRVAPAPSSPETNVDEPAEDVIPDDAGEDVPTTTVVTPARPEEVLEGMTCELGEVPVKVKASRGEPAIEVK